MSKLFFIKYPIRQINTLSISLLFLFLLLFPFANSIAQNKLKCQVKLIVNKGETSGSKIVLSKEGKQVEEIPVRSDGKFELLIDYNSDYILSFEKDGFVSKKISINTVVPDKYSTDKENVKQFDVELNPQKDGMNLMIYNNPVGKIRFEEKTNDFGYDVDYSASIRKQIEEAEKKFAQEQRDKAKEAQKKIDEENKQKLLAEASILKLELEAKKKAEKEAVEKEQARVKAETEAKILAEAKLKEEQKKKELELKQKAIADTKKKAEEDARLKEEARIKEETRVKEETEKRLQAEQEKKRIEQEQKQIEQEKQKKEFEARLAAEAKLKDEANKRELEQRKKAEDDARLKTEAEAKQKEEAIKKA